MNSELLWHLGKEIERNLQLYQFTLQQNEDSVRQNVMGELGCYKIFASECVWDEQQNWNYESSSTDISGKLCWLYIFEKKIVVIVHNN
jgi:hypothetical protein